MKDIFSASVINKMLISAVIIILAMTLWRFVSRGLKSIIEKGGSDGKLSFMRGQAGTTIYGVIKAMIMLFAVIMVLQVNDINISSLITGLGIVGIVVGLAVQDVLKDVIMGLHIVFDDFYKIGDVINYNGADWKVEDLNLRTTKLRSIDDGSIVTLCNSTINHAHKTSKQCDLLIPLSYDADFRHIHEVFRSIEAQVLDIDGVEACRYLGTQEFADSSINYLLRFWCPQERRPSIRRQILAIIQDRLEKEGLEIPFNQLDVHVDGHLPS